MSRENPNKATPPDMIRWTSRSGEAGDCVVAAFTTATGKTYEEVLIAATLNAPNVLRDGLTTKEMIQTATDLGFVPKVVKMPKAKRAREDFIEMLEDEELSGVLSVKQGRDHHAVYVWAGRVIEPRAERKTMWLDISSYLESEGWTATEFMYLKEE